MPLAMVRLRGEIQVLEADAVELKTRLKDARRRHHGNADATKQAALAREYERLLRRFDLASRRLLLRLKRWSKSRHWRNRSPSLRSCRRRNPNRSPRRRPSKRCRSPRHPSRNRFRSPSLSQSLQ